MVNMEQLEKRLAHFKEWITIHYLQQKDNQLHQQLTQHTQISPYTYGEDDKTQFFNVLLITNRLKLEKAREDVLPYIQFGLVFNGGNIVYYTEDATKLSQKKFNEVLLFNIAQFICGAYIRNNSWHVGTAALFLAHYKFITNKPRYAQSKRHTLPVDYAQNTTNFEIFYPVEGIKNFFLNEFVEGRIEFPENGRFTYEVENGEMFETVIGTILQLKCKIGMITLGDGLRSNDLIIKTAFLKENGTLRASSLRRAETKELRELKRVFDTLMGEE